MDPWSGKLKEAQSLDKYTYCQGDPVNSVDPTGLSNLIEKLAVAFGIAAVFGLIAGVYSGWKAKKPARGAVAGSVWAVGVMGLYYKQIRTNPMRALFILLTAAFTALITILFIGGAMIQKSWAGELNSAASIEYEKHNLKFSIFEAFAHALMKAVYYPEADGVPSRVVPGASVIL